MDGWGDIPSEYTALSVWIIVFVFHCESSDVKSVVEWEGEVCGGRVKNWNVHMDLDQKVNRNESPKTKYEQNTETTWQLPLIPLFPLI